MSQSLPATSRPIYGPCMHDDADARPITAFGSSWTTNGSNASKPLVWRWRPYREALSPRTAHRTAVSSSMSTAWPSRRRMAQNPCRSRYAGRHRHSRSRCGTCPRPSPWPLPMGRSRDSASGLCRRLLGIPVRRRRGRGLATTLVAVPVAPVRSGRLWARPVRSEK